MDLKQYRDEIDSIDNEILELLSKRVDIVLKVGEYKSKNGLKVKDSSREESILDRLISLNKSSLSEEDIKGIYLQIISSCRS